MGGRALIARFLRKKYGFGYRAEFFANYIWNDWVLHKPKTDLSLKKKIWLYKNGFVFNRYYMYGLNEENISDYLSDFDYWRVMPFDNPFYGKWLGDKLSTRYVLAPFKEFMPEYYALIDKNGFLITLMDSPQEILVDSDYFLNLTRVKGRIAMKPNGGTEGQGFIKMEYKDGSFFINDKIYPIDDLHSLLGGLKSYLITEYIVQCKEHEAVCPRSCCTLRIKTYKEDGQEPKIMHTWARFGTAESDAVSNVSAGGVAIAYNPETGEYHGRWLYTKGGNIQYYDEHPEYHISLVGQKIPHYDFIHQKLIEIHKYISVLPYLGFDVIVTDDGFKICEINSGPANCYDQALCFPVYKNKDVAAFFDKRLKGPRRNLKK